MTAEQPRCHSVEVDGETVIVRGVGELTEHDRSAIATFVRQLKQRAAEICTCGHLKGEHRIDLKTPVCAAWQPNHIAGACDCREYTPQEGPCSE